MAGFAGKAAAVEDLDDEAADITDGEDMLGDANEGMTGEERLHRVTQKPGMTGLLKFTQHGSMKDIRKAGVSSDILQRVIIEDEWQLTSCLQLPTTIAFFILFMLFFQQHYGTSFIHLQESNLRQNFANAAIDDVGDVDGIYTWMEENLFAFARSTDLSLGAKPFTNDLTSGSEYQTWVAGVKVRTQRVEKKTCEQEVVNGFDCLYMPGGSGMGTVQKQGKPIQETASGVELGGWEQTGTDRRLHESKEQVHSKDKNISDSFDFRRADPEHLAPITHADWIVQKLNRWFPGYKSFQRVGHWDKKAAWEADFHSDPKDAKIIHKAKAKGKDAAALAKTFDEMKAESEEHEAWEARARAKAERHRKKNKKNRRRKVKGMNTMAGTPIKTQRLDDVVRRPSRRKLQAQQAKVSTMVPIAKAPHEMTAADERRLVTNRPEFTGSGWIPFPYAKKDVWEYVIPMSMTEERIKALLAQWKSNEIIDRSTLFFGVEVLFRNDNIGNGLLTHSFINFIFSRGGHIYTEVTMQSLILKTSMGVMGFAFIWIATLVANTISTPARTCKAFKRGGVSGLKSHMKRFWNLLEWFLIWYGWVIVVAFAAERWGMRKFNKQWDEYVDERKPIFLAQDSATATFAEKRALLDFDVDEFKSIHRNIAATGNIDVWLQVIVAHYHVWLILRFFVASRGQPRLAIVVNTMRNAAIDLFHLAIVIAIIFIAYVVSGHILFGRRMESFATIQGSLAYCFQIVLQKEFDFQTLTAQDFYTVTLWVWSFVLLIVLILVNIVLAMIFDTYAEVRNHVTDGDTLFNTVRMIMTQVKLMSVWVTNRDLVVAVKKMSGDQITAIKLREQIPGISNVQIQHLFDSAKNKLETMMTKGNKNAMPEAVASILIGIDQLKNGVKTMMGGRDEGLGSVNAQYMRDDGSVRDSERLSGMAQEPTPLPTDGPIWLQQGLIPHLKRQEKFMDQVQKELQGIEMKIKSRGIGAGLPPVPFEKPSVPWQADGSVDEPNVSDWFPWAGKTPPDRKIGRYNYVALVPPDSYMPKSAGKAGRENPKMAAESLEEC